jgi:hypothetical protein
MIKNSREIPMRDLKFDELQQVYGAGGRGRGPACGSRGTGSHKSKSHKSKSHKSKSHKSKKHRCR